MRAVIITRPGGPEVLEIQERPMPEPSLGQIRVRVRASALNRADLLQREGNYPVPPGYAADIAGMEYAGEVDALGAPASLWKKGDRVMGIIGGAGHAEFLCVHEREAMPIPAGMSYETAAAIPGSVFDSLRRTLQSAVPADGRSAPHSCSRERSRHGRAPDRADVGSEGRGYVPQP
ncbi:MAG: alcohol dehydrogenase catalytic domain-containing protein [Gemmatimonadaceae bacterium]